MSVQFVPIINLVDIRDDLRKPINSSERNRRIAGKTQSQLYPYYGATGQVGWIDGYITDGDYILIGEDGAPFFDHSKEKAYRISGKTWVNNHAHILKPKEDRADADFIKYYLDFFNYDGFVNGTTRLKLTKGSLQQIPVPNFVYKKQVQISKKIKDLFSEIDDGLEDLNRAKANLELYKQSVLNAAIQGKLVPQDPNDEPASKLLERIRDKKEKLIKEGKIKKEKPLPPISPDEVPFEIPKGCEWVRLGDVILSATYGSSSKTNDETNGIPVLRMGNIVDGFLNFEKLKYLPKDHAEFPALLLQNGDLLFNRTNSAELVGKCAVYWGEFKNASYASYLIGLRFHLALTRPDFYSAVINSLYGRDWVRSVMVQQVGQANVNGTKLKNLAVPLPPIGEQNRIVSLLNESLHFARIEEIEVEKRLNYINNLKQSILKSAFEGTLI